MVGFVLENLGQKTGTLAGEFVAIFIVGLNLGSFGALGFAVDPANGQTTFLYVSFFG